MSVSSHETSLPPSLRLPSLGALGRDLLVVSPWDVTLSLFRPLACFTLFWLFAFAHHFVLAAMAVAGLLFFTYTSTSHDLVHRTLHLREGVNEWLLAWLEAITLRSGHAFRITHLQHHKRFPHEDDVEGSQASKGFWSALACGPGHQIRLFLWAWKQGNRRERRWMAGEAACVFLATLGTLFTWRKFPELALYVVLVTVGSWLYPLMTVWCPHRASGVTVLQQTRGFRGRLIPFLFFQHTYHLEHHLYPGVSSHRWAELGRRLQPYLEKAGISFIRLP